MTCYVTVRPSQRAMPPSFFSDPHVAFDNRLGLIVFLETNENSSKRIITKLSVLALVTAALVAPIATLGRQQVDLIENFLTPEEAAFFKSQATSNSLSLPKALVERIKSAIDDQSCLIDHDDEIKVQSMLIKENTKVHEDHFHGAGDPVQESVAVVFLDDNDGGFFRHGEQDVPAVAGRLVKFPGNVPHSSFVEKGSIRLLGPFDTKTFANVGGLPCDADPDSCPSDEVCFNVDGGTFECLLDEVCE